MWERANACNCICLCECSDVIANVFYLHGMWCERCYFCEKLSLLIMNWAQHSTALFKSLSISHSLYFTLVNIRAVRQFLWSVGVYAVMLCCCCCRGRRRCRFFFLFSSFSSSTLYQCFLPGSYRDDKPMPIIDLIVWWFDCINHWPCLDEVFRIALIALSVVQYFFYSDFVSQTAAHTRTR